MPNFILKNVKHNERLSEETDCFSATLYDGKDRLFEVSNRGHGGCNEYKPLPNGTVKDPWAYVKEFDQRMIDEGVKADGEHDLYQELDFIISDLLNEVLVEKQVKNALKRICYVRGDGLVYEMPAKIKPTPENFEKVKKSSWWKADNRILNEMPFDEAKKILSGE